MHGLGIAFVQGIAFLLVFQNAWIGLAELSFVKGIAESLGGFLYLLICLLVIFSNLILYQHIGAIPFLRIAVVNERIVKGIYMPAGLPCIGVHKDGCVDADNVIVQENHALPPVLLDVVFQLNTVLTVVIYGSQSVVYV